jgi:hypothetical protein
MRHKFWNFEYLVYKHDLYFSTNFDMVNVIIWLFKGLHLVFQQISSISHGFQVKLDCSKTGTEGKPFQLHHWCSEFEPRSWRGVLDTTLCDNVCQRLAAGRWFSPVSFTNKTDRHDIAKILLKVHVALNTITLTFQQPWVYIFVCNEHPL